MALDKLLAVLLLLCIMWCANAGECADNRDPVESPFTYTESPVLPGYTSQMVDFKEGALIIPMDGLQHASCGSGLFNLGAYGYITRLLHAELPVFWAIRSGKVHDANDLLGVPTIDISSPSCTGGDIDRDFGGGPFIVPASKATAALAIPRAGIRLFQAVDDFTAPINSKLTNKPKVGVADNNRKEIHLDLLASAGFESGTHYDTMTENLDEISDTTCYTIVTEPHFDDEDDKYGEAAETFLKSGGNMLAQCKAILIYARKDLITTNLNANNQDEAHTFNNADMPYAQFLGLIDTDDSGSVADFDADLSTSTYDVVKSTPGSTRYSSVAGRIPSPSDDYIGGVLHYLGGHDFGMLSLNVDMNLARMYFNAVITPADRPASCNLRFPGDLSVEITDLVDPVMPNTQMDYEVTVSNVGSDLLQNTEIIITVDPTETVVQVSGEPSGATVNVNGKEITIDIGDIVAGDTFTITVTVIPVTIGTVGATVEGTTSSSETTEANNFDCEPTKVCTLGSPTARAVIPKARGIARTPRGVASDITMKFLTCPISYEIGQTITFEFRIKNTATFTYTNLDVMMSGSSMTFVSGTCTRNVGSTMLTPVDPSSNSGSVLTADDIGARETIECEILFTVPDLSNADATVSLSAGISGALDSSPITCDVPALIVSDDTTETLEEYPRIISVVLNDAAFDVSTLTISSPPSGGSVVTNTPYFGQIVYTPNVGFSGMDSFTYQICSAGFVTCGTATVSITVNPRAEVVDDTAGAVPSATTNIDILDNDSNILSSAVSITTGPSISGNTAVVAIDGSVDFLWGDTTSNNGAMDSFEYSVCGESLDLECEGDTSTVENCDSGTVVVTLDACNVITVDHAHDCTGSGDSRVTLSVSGANMPISTVWSNGDTDTMEVLNLASGSYTVDISDQFGCTAQYSFNVDDPSVPASLPDVSAFSCTSSTQMLVSFADTQTCDLSQLSLTVTWDDGTTATFDTPEAGTVAGIGGSFLASHTYSDLGIYTVTFSLMHAAQGELSSGTARITVDASAGVVTYPPEDVNLMMYYPVPVRWVIDDSISLSDVPQLQGVMEKMEEPNKGEKMMLFENLDGSRLDEHVFITHHLFSGKYRLLIQTVDLCIFQPPINIVLYGDVEHYCHISNRFHDQVCHGKSP